MENKKVKKDKENIKTIKMINYTDENIFGVKFSKRAKHIKCAIDYLTLNHLVDKNGMLKKNMYDKIRLRYIWQYLVYIRNHNKELSVFKKHLGTGYGIQKERRLNQKKSKQKQLWREQKKLKLNYQMKSKQN